MNILQDIALVIGDSQYVRFHPEAVPELISSCDFGIDRPSFASEYRFEDPEDTARLLFAFSSINYCFWPTGTGASYGGSGEALRRLYRAALADKTVIDPERLASTTLEDLSCILGDIPLLPFRVMTMRSGGIAIRDKFGGRMDRLLTDANNIAGNIVNLIVKYIPDFDDACLWKGNRVTFHKRAQLLAWLLAEADARISGKEELTGFADYRIPQLLRHAGVISYTEELSRDIDAGIPLVAGSAAETEIRAHTVWAIEHIRSEIGNIAAAAVDAALWAEARRRKSDMAPHHKTISIYY
jgi:hypothetical protein